MPTGFLALPLELQRRIFDEHHYEHMTRGFGEPRENEHPHVRDIAKAIPQLFSLCAWYMHKRPRGSLRIETTLVTYALLEPHLSSAVETLDLLQQGFAFSHGKQPEKLQIQLLLDYGKQAGFLRDNFDEKELCDWIDLALRILTAVRSLWLKDVAKFGTKPAIRSVLLNSTEHLRNIRHVWLEPDWENIELDLAEMISLLLDLPSLELMALHEVGTTSRSRRVLKHEDVKHPKHLRPSRCTHFNFDFCFITRHELSIIAARCKPLVLIHQPFGTWITDDGLEEEEVSGYAKYLEGLASFPRFVQHLEVLEIKDHNWAIRFGYPRMLPNGSTDFSSFKKLCRLRIPIYTLVGFDPQHGEASQLLPPSLEILRLDDTTHLESAFGWEVGDYWTQILEVVRHKPERFPSLREVAISDEMFGLDKASLSEQGRGDILEELVDLAKRYNVTLLNDP